MRILVVEHDKRVAAFVRGGLTAEAFVVDVVRNAHDGLARALAQHYDLVIVELALPGNAGVQVCRGLREADRWAPILLLTSSAAEYKTVAREIGADGYLVKPFSCPVLLEHAHALMCGTTTTSAPMTIQDLTVDPARRRCWRAGVEISLTTREFSVLEFLVRRAGTVLSKQAMLDGVWDYDFDGDPNIVEVYIGRVRRKIDGPSSALLIETVRGAGYRLADGT